MTQNTRVLCGGGNQVADFPQFCSKGVKSRSVVGTLRGMYSSSEMRGRGRGGGGSRYTDCVGVARCCCESAQLHVCK